VSSQQGCGGATVLWSLNQHHKCGVNAVKDQLAFLWLPNITTQPNNDYFNVLLKVCCGELWWATKQPLTKVLSCFFGQSQFKIRLQLKDSVVVHLNVNN